MTIDRDNNTLPFFNTEMILFFDSFGYWYFETKTQSEEIIKRYCYKSRLSEIQTGAAMTHSPI